MQANGITRCCKTTVWIPEEQPQPGLPESAALRRSVAANGELQTAFERQRGRAQPVRRVVHKVKIVVIRGSELLRVIADGYCALAQVVRDQLQRGPRHRGPDVHQHEVNRTADI